MLNVEQHRSALRRRAGAARRVAQGRARQGDLRARPQRRRQDQPAARDRRPAAGQQRARSRFDGQRHHRRCGRTSARARGIAYVPQGREIFPLLTVRGEPRDRLRAAASAASATFPTTCLRAVPGAEDDAAAARRRPLRRPAAAARDRPRAGDAAEAAGARRADRGHPAVDHQGYRPRHRLSARAGRDGDRAGRAISRLRAASSPTISR